MQRKVLDVIVRESDELDARYGRPRRTQIADASISDVATQEELIPDEKALIMFSANGYIKRICDSTFSTQVRECNLHVVVPLLAPPECS